MIYTSIKNIVNGVIESNEIVLCRETAASYLELADTLGIPVRFYTTENKIRNSEYIKGILVETLEEIDTIEKNGILCTTPEQTICDLIECNKNEELVTESIANYFNLYGSFELLSDKANKLKISEKMGDFIAKALKYYA